jgi:hypothetical protein
MARKCISQWIISDVTFPPSSLPKNLAKELSCSAGCRLFSRQGFKIPMGAGGPPPRSTCTFTRTGPLDWPKAVWIGRRLGNRVSLGRCHTGYVKLAIENGPVEIVDLPMKNMVDLSIAILYVYQREISRRW